MYAYYTAYTRREFDYGIRNKWLTFVNKKVFGNYFSHQYHTPRRPLVNIKLNVKYVFVVIVTIDKLINWSKETSLILHWLLSDLLIADMKVWGEKRKVRTLSRPDQWDATKVWTPSRPGQWEAAKVWSWTPRQPMRVERGVRFNTLASQSQPGRGRQFSHLGSLRQ